MTNSRRSSASSALSRSHAGDRQEGEVRGRGAAQSGGADRVRLWVCLVALQACLCHGAADASTIIAAKRSNDFIVVAADSFATDAAGRPREYGKCKIKLLDGRAFFASAGATSSAGTEPGEIAFSSEQEAVRHFDQTKPLAFIADRWATTMEKK